MPRPDRLRSCLVVTALGCTLLLAACGSRVDPAVVAQVNGSPAQGTAAVDGGVAAVGDGAVPGGATAGPGGPGGGAGGSGNPLAGPAGGSEGAGAGEAPAPGQAGEGANAADGGQQAGSCEGFRNTTGITDDTITIANSSDISGPVPGLFEAAQQATEAYAAYFNATGDICGRKLRVMLLDSRIDAGADQQAYTKACTEAFAAVGSMSSFDSGGAKVTDECGLPDLRAYSVSSERTACDNCFAAYAVQPNLVPNAMPQYWNKRAPEAVEAVGMLYINSGAAPENAANFRAAWEANGWDVKVFDAMDSGEFNYAPYVQELKEAGVELVNYTGAYQYTVRLQQAMRQQGYEPEVFLQDATIHDQRYVDQAGEEGEGTFAYSQTALFDDYSVPEMKLYRSWLEQVDPGAEPNTYGLYAWSATRLFVEQSVALGGRLTREALVDRLGTVEDWTSNGVHVPQQVGAEVTASCASIIQLVDGRWRKVSPGKYLCGGITDTGL